MSTPTAPSPARRPSRPAPGQETREDPVRAAARLGIAMAAGSPLEGPVRLAAVAAGRDCPVYLRGESGTGKEMMARFVHARSPRRAGPFVAVNCAAIPPHLIESELFGHRRGAFTGALEDHPGRFRLADGGTLFLDEIGDMPLEVQTRLLRTLQERTVCPVGDRREVPVDFRLVCATHVDLRRAVREGRFREDLFYRVAVVEIRLPALRERPGDLALLLRGFLAEQLGEAGAAAALASLPPELRSHPFPGNVRELRNLAERYAVAREMGGGWREAAGVSPGLPGRDGGSPKPASDALPGGVPAPAPARLRNSRVTEAEIVRALEECGWHRSQASKKLGITRRALQYRLAKMGGNPAAPGSVCLY